MADLTAQEGSPKLPTFDEELASLTAKHLQLRGLSVAQLVIDLTKNLGYWLGETDDMELIKAVAMQVEIQALENRYKRIGADAAQKEIEDAVATHKI